jgi:hypothetical protein
VSTVPTVVAPSSKTWLGIARELTAGTAVLPVQTIPLLKNSYQPEDTPRFLPDEALRGSMAMIFNEVLGVEDGAFNFGGPAFLDVEGYFFDNAFGDLSTTATTTGSSTTTTEAIAIGGTVVTVTSATGFTSGQYAQIDTGSITELVAISSIVSTTITFANNPARFPHASGATIKAVAPTGGPFTHTWNILNNASGQPPTHTVTDYTSLTTTVGARAYPSLCVAQLDITGNAEELLDVKMTGSSWISQAASTTPTNTVSTAVPVPNWRSTVTVGGTQVNDVGEWTVTIKRQLQIYFTNQGSQNPYIIARGPLDATGTLNYTVPSDETPLSNMTANIQPTVQIAITNGLASTSLLSLTLNMTQAAFVKSKPERSGVLLGYQDEWQAVANSTNAGGSGGLGPLTLTLENNVPVY